MPQRMLSRQVKEYLRQLRDSGEEELCLRPETLRRLASYNKVTQVVQKEPSKISTTIGESKAKVRPAKNPELEKFHQEIKDCTKCRLHKGRTKFVFGVGNPRAEVMFIGEGPGRDEDLKGEPFVGRAGQLLDKILASIGFSRRFDCAHHTQTVYIANMVKCRPPENRDPQPDEMETCFPYLQKQIELIQPKIICCLGRISGQYLLKTSETLGRLRGKVHDFNGVKLIVTYHPAALLRYPEYKKETWEDMKLLRKLYEELQ